MHPSFLSRVERGQRRITGAPLARLIIALDWLSGGGSDEGPWAAMRYELPPLGMAVAGPRPPTVTGTLHRGDDVPTVPPDRWLPDVAPLPSPTRHAARRPARARMV